MRVDEWNRRFEVNWNRLLATQHTMAELVTELDRLRSIVPSDEVQPDEPLIEDQALFDTWDESTQGSYCQHRLYALCPKGTDDAIKQVRFKELRHALREGRPINGRIKI